MYLCNRDIQWAIRCGKLIVEPPPEYFQSGYDENSIDLHLGSLQGAMMWDLERYRRDGSGHEPHRRTELELGSLDYRALAHASLVPVPEAPGPDPAPDYRVFRRGNEIVVRHSGFLLWTTRERVGTPQQVPGTDMQGQRHPELICFVNAKSTRARTGLMVHFTAPTIHAGWAGNITLEIINLGPFDFVLREGDVLAQLTVAMISSAPDLELKKSTPQTQGQVDPSGAPAAPRPRKPHSRRKK